MARVKLDSSLSTSDPKDLRGPVQTIFQQLEDQLAGSPDLVTVTEDNPNLPANIQRGDLVFNLSGGVLKIGMYNGKEVVYST